MSPVPTVQGPRWRDVVVGAAFDTRDVLVGLAGEIRRRSVGARATARVRVRRLADRGAVEGQRGRRRAARAVAGIADALARNPVTDRVVDAQLERTVRPLVATVLDDVLATLEADPDRIRSVVRGQRESMVDDIVGRVRGGAAAGDAAVDRFTARVVGRAAPGRGTGETKPP